jgi:8-oxo-dGTP pyrophosphatase MutT (NUDIX family)
VQSTGHEEWGFIKGKIDKNESIPECAKRECSEETNIRFNINDLEDYFYQVNTKKNIGIFLINVNNLDLGRLKLSKKELQDYRFFNIKDNIYISKNQQKILNSIKNKFIF